MKGSALAVAISVLLSLSQSGAETPGQIMNDPDTFAWLVFMELNHPADLSQGRGRPDLDRTLGDEGVVVWETWMRTDEVFLAGGIRPPPWNLVGPASLNAAPRPPSRVRPVRKIMLDDDASVAAALDAAGPPPPELGESSMNEPAFTFIRDNELYNIEGQEAFHAAGRLVNLPTASREIKSAWALLRALPIEELPAEEIDTLKARYHTRQFAHNGKTYIYGLTSLHITTKDLPNWVWATFEHEDNPIPEQPDNDRVGRPASLDGTKWANYRLRGTQIDFTDSTGNATILASTQVEAGFQQTSSCITCHARATIGDPLPRTPGLAKRANRLKFFDVSRILHRRTNPDHNAEQVLRYGAIGAPSAEWFSDGGGQRRYTQLDFMWSLRMASSKEP